MNHRERLEAALDHRPGDRVCVDFGGTSVSGISASVVYSLRRALLGEKDFRVKVIEPFQMLGEVDEPLREAMGVDVAGIYGRTSKFGFENSGWKPLELFDGTPVLVPGGFNVTLDANGDWLMHPGGDTSAPPCARMPKGGFYFDAIPRQGPIDEDALDPADNLEEFAPLSQRDLDHYAERARQLSRTDAGGILMLPGTGFGDIANVPGLSLRRPRGIRGVEGWYVSTALRRDYVYKVFEGQCKVALANLDLLADTVGDAVSAAYVSGTDFGTQRGLFLSAATYRDLFKPFHKKVNDFIHSKTRWKTFMHSCGSVVELIPDFLEAGFDILNPVQCSAAGMDARALKERFGSRVVFWGGGVDTQKTLPFGSPGEVYDEVRARIEIFRKGGGFVFNTIHNIQPRTPVENVLAMLRAIRDSGR
jgi:hypothetical protein